MANIKSQIKRNETNELAREKNNTEKNAARTAIKKVETLVGRWQKGEAQEALKEAVSLLDQLAQRGTISDNSCARKKAHLQHLVAALK
jgi:small subunit ribosomal protein S20